MTKRSIEKLGWERGLFSGIRVIWDREDSECSPNAFYREHAIVLGWYAYQFRTWRIL